MSKGTALYERARGAMTGGAGAGGRYNPLLEQPLYISRGRGARFEDVDGNEYIDLFTGSGATFLGHNHPALREAITRALDVGVICNGETEHHVRLAEMIIEAVPCAERVRYANSGTEATMGAIRIARAFTGKPRILKFEGHFHGMHDYLWFNCSTSLGGAGEEGTIPPVADSEGIPDVLEDLVVVVPFNDVEAFGRAVAAHGESLAAVIMEPVSYNQGCIPSDPDFLREVRRTCTKKGIVLIFDEILSGFRMRRGGAQEYYGVLPDLCTLAKALGGGVPIAAVCGRADIMSVLNPVGRTVMSGTYTGHLTAVLGAIACQEILARPAFYEDLNALAGYFYQGIRELLNLTGTPAIVQGLGARFGIYFGLTEPVRDYADAVRFDREMEVRFLRGCLRRGLYLHDYGHRTPMHHGFSAQHTRADMDEALGIMEEALRALHR